MAAEKSSKRVGLSSLAPAKGSKHRRKILGKGEGSGSGKTCGRGTKGYKSRSGSQKNPGFEGGQMPLHRRLPKLGFISRKKLLGKNAYTTVALGRLLERCSENDITIAKMVEVGLVRNAASRVKILGGAECTRKIKVDAHACSESAAEAIKKLGGEVRIIA